MKIYLKKNVPSYKELIRQYPFLAEDVFISLRGKIKKRNKKILGTKKAHDIDRKLKNKIFPYGLIQHPCTKQELVRYMKSFHESEILGALNKKRSPDQWISGSKRKKILFNTIEISNFSFIDYPDDTLLYFKKIAEYESYVKEAHVNFMDDYVLDIAPYLLFGIIQKDMYPFMINGKIKSGITCVIEKLELDKFIGITIEAHNQNPNVFALPLIYKPRRSLTFSTNVSTLEIDISRLVTKIDEWLSKLEHPMMLTDEGKMCVQTFSGEILDNAQRHSIQNQEGNWYMAGFMEYRNGHYSCCLSFVNTGLPIYETISNTENEVVKQNLELYLKKHKHIDKTLLATVYALQDGSTRQNYEGSRGGVGMRTMVQFINEIGETEENLKPITSIITGNVCIIFKDNYRNFYKSNLKYVQWFNQLQSQELPPDKNNVFLLKNYFPGTIISTRFLLDDKALRKRINNNENN